MLNLEGFKRVGQDVTIWPKAHIVMRENIEIGNNVIIDDFVFMVGKTSIVIGDFVHLSSASSYVGAGPIIIDDFTGVSGGVRFYSSNDDYSGEWMQNPTVPSAFRRPLHDTIHVEKHVLIGANAVVVAGVNIGEGVAIGANSLVATDCEPWVIYAGNPAKPIKQRKRERILSFEREIRALCYDRDGRYISKSAWWSLLNR